MGFSLAAFAFAPGLALGSFMNVVAARVPLRRSLVSPGSACMSCGHEIGWRDNIPVVSWLLLRGRCRHCHDDDPVALSGRGADLGAARRRLRVEVRPPSGGARRRRSSASSSSRSRRRTSSTGSSRTASSCRPPWSSSRRRPRSTRARSGPWPHSVPPASSSRPRSIAPGGMGMGDVKLALVLGAMLGTTVTVAMLARHARRDGAGDRPLHSPRCRRQEGQAPVRAVPRARLRRGSLRRHTLQAMASTATG